jgi:hypothetical protein
MTETLPPPIAGVTPPSVKESVVMTVWPSLAALGIGRFLGRLYKIDWGFGVLTVGHLIALLTAPLAAALVIGRFAVAVKKELPLIGWMFAIIPLDCFRYVLTNRRVVIQRGINPVDEVWIELDRFDTIDIEVQPGQEWYHAGNLIFRRGPIETIRLVGVARPEAFRQTCLKARAAYVGVKGHGG